VTYQLLRLAHFLGLALIAGGLIGVWVSDLRMRQLRDLALLAEAARNLAIFYDAAVVPGALLLAGSGATLIVLYHGGWAFLEVPWLAGMVALFAFEFIEGNTVTRLHFMRLRRLTRQAAEQGRASLELERARRSHLPTFTHFLDIPLLLVIVALGVLRPDSWSLFAVGGTLALIVAALPTLLVARLYPSLPDDGTS
jgi:uncharacterized membrane protein